MEDHADSGWEEELDENLIRALDEAYCQDLQSCMKDVEPAPNRIVLLKKYSKRQPFYRQK